ncbi:MAG TPA: AI-2E family transporter [Thermomicrobiales bacterium]|nr:AI-2E family transporter [Thermomicrobiales bacterium]
MAMVDPNPNDPNKGYRILLVTGTLLLIGWIAWSVRGALFPFAIGALIAYVLLPFVERLERMLPRNHLSRGTRRTIAILEVYVVFFGSLTILALTAGPILVEQSEDLIDNLPAYWESARQEFDYWNQRYEREVPEDIKIQIEENYDEVTNYLSGIGGRLAGAAFGTIQRFISLVAGLVLLPLWLFYVLKDQRRGLAIFYRLWPEEIREDVHQVLRIIDRILGAYIRGQLFLGLVVGVVTGIGMWVIGVQQPLALGIVAGIFEMVPILGPWISFAVAAVVVLATDPDKIFLVAILSFGVQQLENSFLVPRVQGSAVNMNPAIIMILLVVGGALWGIIGVIIIVPLAAIFRDVFFYIYGRLEHPEIEDESKLSPAGPIAPSSAPDAPPERQPSSSPQE